MHVLGFIVLSLAALAGLQLHLRHRLRVPRDREDLILGIAGTALAAAWGLWAWLG